MISVNEKYDQWLMENGEIAALTLKQYLASVEGKNAVIFPPTYSKPEGWKEEDWLGYNIDKLSDGTNVCVIDSVGSQSNRIEPIFKKEKYKHLVPQVIIIIEGKEVNLLDVGHRAADAIVKYSELGDEIEIAYKEYEENGNADLLAKIAPTSIVFGSWNSRGSTRAKLPRVIRSVIRAFNVEPLHRSAQYVPPIEYTEKGIFEKPAKNSQEEQALGEKGFSPVPASWKHGGVLVKGEIVRDCTINLSAIKSLGASSDEQSIKLRRYILGLCLICITSPMNFNLREGCHLVLDPAKRSQLKLVKYDGNQEDIFISAEEAFIYADAVARDYGVGQDRKVLFNKEKALLDLSKSKKQRKDENRKKQPQESE